MCLEEWLQSSRVAKYGAHLRTVIDFVIIKNRIFYSKLDRAKKIDILLQH